MNLKELEYLVTLADEKSISRAADRLYMAQSSLSEFLRQYERELGTTLFFRTAKGIRPTAGGEIFIEHIREILRQYRKAENELWDVMSLHGGRLTLGISSFRGQYLIPRVLKLFQEKHPMVKVEIVEANSMELENLLLDGVLDLAVVVLPLVRLKQDVEFLKTDELVIVANKKHPVMEYVHYSGEETVPWIELKDAAHFEFILSGYNTILGNMGRAQFKQQYLEVTACNYNITAPFAAAMAREGLGLAFTYESCREPYPDAVYLRIGSEGVLLNLALAYPISGYRSKAALVLGRMLHQYFENEQNSMQEADCEI